MNNEVQIFLQSVRVAVPERPDPKIERDLVKRLAETARAATLEAPTVVDHAPDPRATSRKIGSRSAGLFRRRTALPARVAIAAGALLVSTAGLAVAGVKLPEPVSDAFDTVGVSLPNQDDDSGSDGTGKAGETKPGKQGENGNSGRPHPAKGKKDTPPGHTNNPANPQGQAIGHGGTPPGQTKPKGSSKPATPPGQSKPKGSSNGSSGSGNSQASGKGRSEVAPAKGKRLRKRLRAPR